ncbi:MAG: serine/threonine protein kinase, partial [Anaerolineales bacterium]|nr:serine/threonine protein kinase [Anaerolineales bacterium]
MSQRPATERIGTYEIVARLHRSSRATVYRAQDANGRPVAIKLLTQLLDHADAFRQQLDAQFATLASLAHPHILTPIETGQHKDLLYIVMPFLSGGTLRQLLEGQNRLSPARLWSILADVAAALDAAHARGIVHRDVKPGNVLFDAHGRPQLADFGFSLNADVTVHAAGLPGTVTYMAPEQFSGAAPGRHADQYSLAVIAYEALTGRPPFQGNLLQVSYQQLHDAPDFTAIDNPALARVLARALAKSAGARFPSVSAFVTAAQQADIPAAPQVEADATLILDKRAEPYLERPVTPLHPVLLASDPHATLHAGAARGETAAPALPPTSAPDVFAQPPGEDVSITGGA